MTREEIKEKVKTIAVQKLGVREEQVTDEADWIVDLGADSLDQVELLMEFEDVFNIEIPDEEAWKIKTVKEAVDYLEKRVEGK
jgi:acyl carrier protein